MALPDDPAAAEAALADTDTALAEHLATEAGRLLLRLRADDATRTAADGTSDAYVLGELAARRPADVVLSEESPDDPARLAADRVWIVDPLDGTKEYRTGDRSDWAVHVALWSAGELVAGVVTLPALDELWSTARVPPRADGPVRRIAVSRTRAPAWTAAVAADLGAELVPMGSAGAKVAAVLRGEVDAYLHDGGQYEWDSAAPVAVARAAGLHASRVDGGPLEYNRPDPWSPDLVVCTTGAAPRLLTLIDRHRKEPA